jgi:hypothetical protein
VTTAMNAVRQIMAGRKDIQPVDFHELKAMLPASLSQDICTDVTASRVESPPARQTPLRLGSR